MDPRDIVLATIRRVCEDKGASPSSIDDGDLLGEAGIGLDSLDMATIVAELDARLHKDPFATGTPSFRTVGDLVRLFADGSG